MRRVVFLILFLITGCEDYLNNPYLPIPAKYRKKGEVKPKTAHEKLEKSFYTGDDFTKNLNLYMDGPTSNYALSATESSSSTCGMTWHDETSFEVAEVNEATWSDQTSFESVEEQMNGFPLTISDKVTGSIKGEPQVQWDECKGIKSNYDDGSQNANCKKRTISKEYISFFDKNFSKCVQQASSDFSENNAMLESIKFSHAGIAGDQRHTNRSYHSVNRAMDIKTISFVKNGETKTMKVSDQKKSPTKEFFESFRKCWNDKIVEYKSNCPGSSNKGSIGHENKNHQHHLHLSLPYCPRTKNGSKYYVK